MEIFALHHWTPLPLSHWSDPNSSQVDNQKPSEEVDDVRVMMLDYDD